MSTSWDMRIPHPEFGWALKADVDYHYRMAKELVHVRHNSKGFHDSEHRYENPAKPPRIVVLGDSIIRMASPHDLWVVICSACDLRWYRYTRATFYYI